MVKIRIENSYIDGYEHTREVTLPNPASSSEDDMDAWWDDVIFPETGSGRPSNIRGISEVTIIEADDPALVGKTYSWEG